MGGRAVGWRKHATWEHGTLYGYRSGKCRCADCQSAHTEHMREYNTRYRALRGLGTGRRARTMDVVEGTPMQSCNCSLRGWDPPWQWTWDRAFSFTPFSEMRPWPTALDFVDPGPLGPDGKPVRRWRSYP